jgi:hypothetical protein
MKLAKYSDEPEGGPELSPLRFYDVAYLIGGGSFLLGMSMVLIADQVAIHAIKGSSYTGLTIFPSISIALAGIVMITRSAHRMNRLIRNLRNALLATSSH